jgi:hypothetical protein
MSKYKKQKQIKVMKQNPTTAIKCKFSNAIHKLLEPNIDIKKSHRWKYSDKYKLSDKQKLEIFEEIQKLHTECSSELTAYQYDRREKKRVQKARIERGYVPKKQTKKEDYLKSIESI